MDESRWPSTPGTQLESSGTVAVDPGWRGHIGSFRVSIVAGPSGFFFAVAVLRYGVTKWRETFINTPDSDIHVGAWWDWAMRLVVVESIVLMVWWLAQSWGDDPAARWTLMSSFNVGTVLIQWAIVLFILLLLSGRLARGLKDDRGTVDAAAPPPADATG